MSEFLIWRDAWLLGIEALDADHKEMVRLLNALVPAGPVAGDHSIGAAQAEAADLTRETVRGRLEALISLLRHHFDREESFLRAIDYPGYTGHQREHIMQMAEFTDLRRCLNDSETGCMDEETVQSIKNWFFNHVIAEDRLFADYFFRVCNGRIPDDGGTENTA
jgi:hemerythrin